MEKKLYGLFFLIDHFVIQSSLNRRNSQADGLAYLLRFLPSNPSIIQRIFQ